MCWRKKKVLRFCRLFFAARETVNSTTMYIIEITFPLKEFAQSMSSDFYDNGMRKLVPRWQSCVDSNGAHFRIKRFIFNWWRVFWNKARKLTELCLHPNTSCWVQVIWLVLWTAHTHGSQHKTGRHSNGKCWSYARVASFLRTYERGVESTREPRICARWMANEATFGEGEMSSASHRHGLF